MLPVAIKEKKVQVCKNLRLYQNCAYHYQIFICVDIKVLYLKVFLYINIDELITVYEKKI